MTASKQISSLEIWTLVLALWIGAARAQMPAAGGGMGGGMMGGGMMGGGMMGAQMGLNFQLVNAVKELIHPNAQPSPEMIAISQRHRSPPRTISQLLEYTPHFITEAQKHDVRVPGVHGRPSVALLRSHLIAKGTEWMNRRNANGTGGPGGRMAAWNNWLNRNSGGGGGGGAQRGSGGGRGGAGGGAGAGGMGQWSSFMGQWANMFGGGGAGGGGNAGGGAAANGGGNGGGGNGGGRNGRRRGNRRQPIPTQPPVTTDVPLSVSSEEPMEL